jgi:FkbM family methyltransferase
MRVFAPTLCVLLSIGVAAFASPARAQCHLAGVKAAQLRGPNGVPLKRLCPRLLRDGRKISAFVDAFPKRQYQIKAVKGAGRYYIDQRKDVIKDILRRGHIWESDIRRLLKQYVKPGTTVADIGAHIGTHTIYMSKLVGRRGRVYAFEPQRKLFRELVHNLALNGSGSVVPLRYALGVKPAVIQMNRSAAGNEGGTAVGSGGDRAELRTLDSFGLENVSLLKVDVEGFEDKVLAGARKTIARNRPAILVEIQGGNDLDSAPLLVKRRIWSSIGKLARLGYVVQRVGVHDYLALPAKPGSALKTGYSRPIPALSKRLKTGNGQRQGAGLKSDARGRLVYGPYEYLPAGAFVVQFVGRSPRSCRIDADVVSGRGVVRHGRRILRVARRGRSFAMAQIAFTLTGPVKDIEYRLSVIDNACGLVLEKVVLHQLVGP